MKRFEKQTKPTQTSYREKRTPCSRNVPFHPRRGTSCRQRCFYPASRMQCGLPLVRHQKSWRSDLHPQRKIDDLAREAAEQKIRRAIIVITGGEPLHHNLDDLTEAIRTRCELPIHIETSGVDAISGKPNWITLSPKRHKPPRVDLLSACDELKVVVFDEKDLEFAKECAKQASQAVWLLQPGWGNEQGQEIAILHAQSQPKWRLSLQSHKWLKVR